MGVFPRGLKILVCKQPKKKKKKKKKKNHPIKKQRKSTSPTPNILIFVFRLKYEQQGKPSGEADPPRHTQAVSPVKRWSDSPPIWQTPLSPSMNERFFLLFNQHTKRYLDNHWDSSLLFLSSFPSPRAGRNLPVKDETTGYKSKNYLPNPRHAYPAPTPLLQSHTKSNRTILTRTTFNDLRAAYESNATLDPSQKTYIVSCEYSRKKINHN